MGLSRGGLLLDAWYSEADRQYIRQNYILLTELADRSGYSGEDIKKEIADGNLPQAPYSINGEPWVAADYVTLREEAQEQNVAVQQVFGTRYLRARKAWDGKTPDAKEIEDEWQGYLGGDYGICLRKVTPENIVAKGHFIAVIHELIRNPRLNDSVWQEELRQSVAKLDALERPFAVGDYLRFDALSSRALYIEAPKALFPEVFIVGL